MSEDPEIKRKPAAAFPPAPPAAPVGPPAPAGTGSTPATPPAPVVPPKPPGPVIEYALPARKSYIPSPALIRNLGCLFKMLFALTFMLGLGYFALVAMNPKARKWATQGAKDGSGGPTPFKSLNQVLAIPAQAMGKTDDVVKANNARVGQLDGLVAEEEAKAAAAKGGKTSRPVVDPFSTPAAPAGDKKGHAGAAESSDASPQAVSSAAILALAEKQMAKAAPDATPEPAPAPVVKVAPAPAPDTPDQMKLAGDIIIAHASPAGSPRASATFFYWIVNLNISGITQGKPARALINNRLVYEGDEVNRGLGVVFVQLDSTNKLLVFRDKTGAIVTRSY